MRDLLSAIGVALVANAVGLVVAALVLDDMALTAPSFLLALVVLSAVEVVAHAVIVRAGSRYLPGLVGASALLATAVGLGAAVVLADGLHVRGVATWVLATVIVWAAAVVAGALLPRVWPAIGAT